MKDRKLRVAMLIQRYYPHIGGAERQLESLVPLLQKEGCQIDIITRQNSTFPSREVVHQANIHRIDASGPKPVASASYTLGGLLRLKQLRPDVIHAHELLSPTTTAVAAKRLLGTPVVAKVLCGGSLGDIAKLQKTKIGHQRIRVYRKWVDKFVVVSSEIDNELATNNIPPEKRCFIPNGVDTNRFTPVTSLRKKELRTDLALFGGPIGIFTGRLDPQKRLDYLIKQWYFVRRKHPNALLLIVGTGEEQTKLQTLLAPGVQMVGAVENVVPYLQASDLFVLTSAREGLSNAMLEAMATALPVIATDVGGSRDIIQNGSNGYLVPVDDPAALQNALCETMCSSVLRHQLGSEARNTVMQKYSLEQTAQKLRRLYDSLMFADFKEAGA